MNPEKANLLHYIAVGGGLFIAFTRLRSLLDIDNGRMARVFIPLVLLGALLGASPAVFPYAQSVWTKWLGVSPQEWKP